MNTENFKYNWISPEYDSEPDKSLRNLIIDVLKSYETEMENYGYFSSNKGIPKDDYEEISSHLLFVLRKVKL